MITEVASVVEVESIIVGERTGRHARCNGGSTLAETWRKTSQYPSTARAANLS
ncbi:hypothetical protein GCM10008969_25210 [Pseudomonas veronii subsp. inensis]